jgi:hypothetical protein
MSAEDLFGALARGAITAAAVAALLLAAQRWGREVGGLLAGLPTVTGPAMLWLALDHGQAFAGEAAQGAVLAGAACAVFGLVYGLASLTHGRFVTLALASALSLPPLLLLLAAPSLHMLAALGLVTAICVACMAALPRVASRSVAAARPGAVWQAGLMTAAVSGAVSALASLLAPQVTPVVAGALTSPPLVAAAVAWELHRRGCPARVLDFLRGYTAGLVGRCAFVALFGALLAPAGLLPALAAAVVLVLALAWVTGVWMKWRARRSPANALNA